MIIRPKNWNEFQHYKTRRPPWIKLHKKLLDDYEFSTLCIEAKALAPLLWLLASESDDGCFRADSDVLSFRLHIASKVIAKGVSDLISKGFFECMQDASNPLASGLRSACLETETETEREGDFPEREEQERRVVVLRGEAGKC